MAVVVVSSLGKLCSQQREVCCEGEAYPAFWNWNFNKVYTYTCTVHSQAHAERFAEAFTTQKHGVHGSARRGEWVSPLGYN